MRKRKKKRQKGRDKKQRKVDGNNHYLWSLVLKVGTNINSPDMYN